MKLPKNVSHGQLLLPLFEIARVLVRFDFNTLTDNAFPHLSA
jgi:hypothetical protein